MPVDCEGSTVRASATGAGVSAGEDSAGVVEDPLSMPNCSSSVAVGVLAAASATGSGFGFGFRPPEVPVWRGAGAVVSEVGGAEVSVSRAAVVTGA